jgi:hypothetical protein
VPLKEGLRKTIEYFEELLKKGEHPACDRSRDNNIEKQQAMGQDEDGKIDVVIAQNRQFGKNVLNAAKPYIVLNR